MKLKQQLQCELARRDFFEFCSLLNPKFYKTERNFLKELCSSLQDFYYNDDEFMLVNCPPRHGKSFTGTNFVEWVLGKDPLLRIISASYSHDLSKTFSKTVREVIAAEKLSEDILVYNDIFPSTKIKFGSAEAMKWQTDESRQINYLATSPGGSATGFGAEMIVIDDVVKNAAEANNERVLEEHWDWFANTLLSRREGKKKVLVIMTRWNSRDLAGRLLEFLKEHNYRYNHINFKAEQEDGTMLCEDIFSKKDVVVAKRAMGADIYSANYNQEPLDLKGCLYTSLLEYDKVPSDIKAIENYTDTADVGEDSLCSITYAVDKEGNGYILDVIFTKEAMDVTEELVAKRLTELNVNYARIESNNGGLGFSRNVKRIATEKYFNKRTIFKPFHQSANKISRILTGSTGVMRNVYFPKGWKEMYPSFATELLRYQREGKNSHDDSADALTGVYETLEKKYIKKKSIYKGKGW